MPSPKPIPRLDMGLVKAPPDPRVRNYYESKLLNSRGQPLTPSTCSSASSYASSIRSTASTVATAYSSAYSNKAPSSPALSLPSTPGYSSQYGAGYTPAAGARTPSSAWGTPKSSAAQSTVRSNASTSRSLYSRVKDPALHAGRDASVLRGTLGRPAVPSTRAHSGSGGTSRRRSSLAGTAAKPPTPDFASYSSSPRRLSVDTPTVRLTPSSAPPPPSAIRRSDVKPSQASSRPPAAPAPSARLQPKPKSSQKQKPLKLTLAPSRPPPINSAAASAPVASSAAIAWDEDVDEPMILVDKPGKGAAPGPGSARPASPRQEESEPLFERVQNVPSRTLEVDQSDADAGEKHSESVGTAQEPTVAAHGQQRISSPTGHLQKENTPIDDNNNSNNNSNKMIDETQLQTQQPLKEATKVNPMAPRNRVSALAREAADSRIQGDYDKAVQLCVQRLAYARFAYPKTSVQMVNAHADLARNYTFKVCPKQALDHLQKALSVADGAGAKPTLVSTLESAVSHLKNGDIDQATRAFRQMETI